ncbi:hypothetical protein JF66_05545 [Cryobacterium sp. MLB-32]|uniref:hypothetical protein n=1 Tax=Cryobacterium sp. MLB-32 TaxID=1529318 RepID=UPI0004E657BD|nr:hypothetical protein [Cryobacterium sp. MLB-32]KFF60274.1 hypothetical protein JF66_05545 [Cryobacterium sp. MLB-32]
MDTDEAAALWAEAHSPVDDADLAAHIARLEAIVYSKSGSAEAAVDFLDPVTGQSIRTTPSQLRLRVLRSWAGAGVIRPENVEPIAPLPKTDGPRPDDPSPQTSESSARNARLRRRFVLPLVAVAAFALGVVTTLVVGSIAGPASAALEAFESPSPYPDTVIPYLGRQFQEGSIRDISGLSPVEQGVGVYLGRTASSGLYCLIARTDPGLTLSSCSTADEVARRGLVLEAPVTIPSTVTRNADVREIEKTFTFTPQGLFVAAFTDAEERAVAPPATQGVQLSQWASLPSDVGFGGEIDANGEGLIVALNCAGQGTVTVDVGGYLSVFSCVPGEIQGYTNYDYTAHGTAAVVITPAGNVSWGLTVSSISLDTPAPG